MRRNANSRAPILKRGSPLSLEDLLRFFKKDRGLLISEVPLVRKLVDLFRIEIHQGYPEFRSIRRVHLNG